MHAVRLLLLLSPLAVSSLEVAAPASPFQGTELRHHDHRHCHKIPYTEIVKVPKTIFVNVTRRICDPDGTCRDIIEKVPETIYVTEKRRKMETRCCRKVPTPVTKEETRMRKIKVCSPEGACHTEEVPYTVEVPVMRNETRMRKVRVCSPNGACHTEEVPYTVEVPVTKLEEKCRVCRDVRTEKMKTEVVHRIVTVCDPDGTCHTEEVPVTVEVPVMRNETRMRNETVCRHGACHTEEVPYTVEVPVMQVVRECTECGHKKHITRMEPETRFKIVNREETVCNPDGHPCGLSLQTCYPAGACHTEIISVKVPYTVEVPVKEVVRHCDRCRIPHHGKHEVPPERCVKCTEVLERNGHKVPFPECLTPGGGHEVGPIRPVPGHEVGPIRPVPGHGGGPIRPVPGHGGGIPINPVPGTSGDEVMI